MQCCNRTETSTVKMYSLRSETGNAGCISTTSSFCLIGPPQVVADFCAPRNVVGSAGKVASQLLPPQGSHWFIPGSLEALRVMDRSFYAGTSRSQGLTGLINNPLKKLRLRRIRLVSEIMLPGRGVHFTRGNNDLSPNHQP
jgi:hypothetical protein